MCRSYIVAHEVVVREEQSPPEGRQLAGVVCGAHRHLTSLAADAWRISWLRALSVILMKISAISWWAIPARMSLIVRTGQLMRWNLPLKRQITVNENEISAGARCRARTHTTAATPSLYERTRPRMPCAS